MSRILVVDDDRAICRSLEIQLAQEGHEVQSAPAGNEGLALARSFRPEILFLDLMLPDTSGLDVLRALAREGAGGGGPEMAVVMISGAQDMRSTIDCIRLGAFDYIRKPLDRDDVLLAIEKARRHLESAAKKRDLVPVGEVAANPHEIVGADRAVLEVIKQVGLLSKSRVTVLILGETGTGKELVARAIHEAGSPGEPFVAINSSALVETLLESELFGHEKGAFTGADARKPGKLELAGEGTVFFDEVGDMSLDLQARLLRALQERTFERVGGTEPIPLKARVLAATHRDLEREIRSGRFRQDLLFRLAVTTIAVPPLRERRGDVPLLARHLLGRIGAQLGRRVEAVAPEVLAELAAHDWPGNVRELENVLTRAVALSRGPVIDALPPGFGRDGGGAGGGLGAPLSVLRPLEAVEREHIAAVLAETGWNISRSARVLEISPTTLRKKIADFGLERPADGR